MIKALLLGLLEPTKQWEQLELQGDYTSRLALMEEQKSMPFGAVWDYHCLSQNVPVGMSMMDEIRTYEKDVQLKR